MARVTRERSDLSLVVTSKLEGWTIPDGIRTVELGFVDDDTLAALYRACTALAFPSRYEGFGLPVLEAMSYGAPVVASNASAVPEAGGEAAAYVPVANPQALATAILRVASDETFAAELRRLGPLHAAEFTWDRTATQTLDVIESVVVGKLARVDGLA
jgi:glycosyltransferase involved in cell wall biosynthesis